MKAINHLFLSPVLLLLYPFFGNGVIISMIASVLIDIDHISVLIKQKANSYQKIKSVINKECDEYDKYSKKAKSFIHNNHFPLHSLECLAIIFGLSLIWDWMFLIGIGFTFHLIIDLIHHYVVGFPTISEMIYLNKIFKK